MADLPWKRTQVEPEVILDALKSLGGHAEWSVNLVPEGWLPAEILYQWAEIGLNNDHPLGMDIAFTYAKRSVCRRIDGLLLNNYCGKYGRAKYPLKIEILKEIGIPIPNIVHKWVISGRNEIEHNYQGADKGQATDAVEIAQLFLNATATEAAREVVLVAGGSTMHTYGGEIQDPELARLNDLGFSRDPFVFADIADAPGVIKIVYPLETEISECPLDRMSQAQTVEFARIMRQYRPWLNDLPIKIPRGLIPGLSHVRQLKERTGI